MADPALIAIATTVGSAAGVGIGKLWDWYTGRKKAKWERDIEIDRRDDLAKDQLIAALGAELAHERGERARERKESKETTSLLGIKLDDTKATLERERLQVAGVTVRQRLDSQIDNSEYEPALPKAVRAKADIIAPQTSSSTPPPAPVHPDTERDLRRYSHADKASTPPDPAPVAHAGAYREKQQTLKDIPPLAPAPVPPRPERKK